MFPKKYRFESRISGDFFAKAKKYNSNLFVLYVQKRDDRSINLAIIIPKKQLPKATQRNLIKRQITPVLLEKASNFTGHNLVFYLKSKIDESETKNLIENLGIFLDDLSKKLD